MTGSQQQWLDRELSLWQADQVVSTGQADQIRGRYESADEIHERKRSVAVQALFGMAACLFGLAVLLLVGFNWDQLGREVKLVVVLTVVTATHLGAFRLRRDGKHLVLSETVSFMGCLFYGAGIWLVAQAFHLEAHYPDGVWWWAIGVLPFALCLDSLLLHVLFASLMLLCVSVGLLFAFRGLGAFDLRGEASESDSIHRRWFAIILVGSLLLMAAWSLVITEPTFASSLPIVVANLVSLGMALYLVKVGEQEERTRPFAAGVLMFLLWALVRYIDLFGAAGGMLGAAIVFALCGGGLVVVGNFWSRKRRARQHDTPLRQAETLTTPAWVNTAVEWLGSHRGPILISAAIAQVVLLGGMILIESLPLLIGERVILKVTPIDPRDFFRGDYVILNYEFNRLQITQDPGDNSVNDAELISSSDRAVYVPLERDADGRHWRGTTAKLSKPSGVKYLRGRITGDYRQRLQFGIEAYYVQEGKGLELEKIRNSRNLSAEVAIAPWGQAKLVRLIEE